MDQNWCKPRNNVWAIAVVIFSYTGSPQVKISQKVLVGGYFFDSHCIETNTNSRKSEHKASDLCVIVVKVVTTHSSPSVVVVDLKTSSIGWSVITSKSHRH